MPLFLCEGVSTHGTLERNIKSTLWVRCPQIIMTAVVEVIRNLYGKFAVKVCQTKEVTVTANVYGIPMTTQSGQQERKPIYCHHNCGTEIIFDSRKS